MLTKFRVRNFKCLEDVSLELGAFNVLIGPNDTGKSSVLEALAILSHLLSNSIADAFKEGGLHPANALRQGSERPVIAFDSSGRIGGVEINYSIEVDEKGMLHAESLAGLPEADNFNFHRSQTNLPDRPRSMFAEHEGRIRAKSPASAKLMEEFYRRLRVVQYCLEPNKLRARSEPAKDANVPELKPNGEGLATVLEYLLLVEQDRFDQLQERLCKLVPYLRGARPQPENGGRQIAFFTKSGKQKIPAPLASDGLLLLLGYLALLYLPNPLPGIILIDEPEFGIHPRRLKEVVELLRELAEQESVQIILTTHSPYLLDWVKPEEVHILTRGQNLGTRATRMTAIPDLEVLLKGYQLGELWFNYGEDELVKGAN